jgi:hypothetical protein
MAVEIDYGNPLPIQPPDRVAPGEKAGPEGRRQGNGARRGRKRRRQPDGPEEEPDGSLPGKDETGGHIDLEV